MKKTMIVAASMAALLAIGCREEASEARPETSTTEVAGVGSPNDVSPINAQTWVDDVTIGHQIGADGAMVTGQGGDDFAPGQPIHISMKVDDAPQNTAVKLVWYGPNETKIGEESKNVAPGQQYLTFSTTDTKTWAKGDYRAELWVGDEKVNTQQFQIVDAAAAGK